jgi:hypothetical protein
MRAPTRDPQPVMLRDQERQSALAECYAILLRAADRAKAHESEEPAGARPAGSGSAG